ncbi:cytochrome C [Nitrosophilus kaiyonis]|uniref:cytochrome C n=1 Tax=Nitrosophilus kaiyonis TaxID=2930200 RepID=UPI002491C988|nr:cytochrome C [Nitrosophilus kaiyonis]
MFKKIFIFNILISLSFLSLHASVFKGQKEYMKKCKKCHGNGAKVAKAKTSDEWINLFKNNGLLIKKAHNTDEDAMKYFNSKRFEKKSIHLLDFLKKYSSDSGNVPACSD